MGVCVKLSANAGYAPAEIVFYRSLVGLIIMAVIVRWRGVSLATPHWGRQMKRGVTGFCSLSVYFYAIGLLPLATAVTLNYTSPIFLMVMLALFRGLRLNAGVGLSLGLGMAGVACMLHPSFGADALYGCMVALGSAVLAAMTYFDVRDLGQRGEPEARTVFYFAVSSVALATVWICFTTLHELTLAGFCKLAGVGVFATLAQLAMTRAYARGKVLLSASLAYSTVLFSTIFGVLFLGDGFGWLEALGMALVMVSGVAANYFSAARK
ncbi:MAG: DMT family transporter [Azoarcus sp.]|jgi:S-adenosylmethionine uptake transporter|nr:DMT family transporter [Azoarcus sp.]